MNSHRLRDMLIAFLFLALALIAVFAVIPVGVVVPSSVKKAALSPDFWPRLIAYGTIAASVLLFIETMTMQPPVDDGDIDESAEFKMGALSSAARAAGLIVAFFVFFASLATFGVVVASAILMFAMMLFFGERNIWLAAGLSIAVPVLLYLFFRYVASVPIPLGIFAG
jgi:putative tricarboxylic transport membrane protein